LDVEVRQERERRMKVLGAIPYTHDVRDLDTQLAQPLGDPRPVSVGYAPGQNLSAGDDDPGTDAVAHGHFDPWKGISRMPPASRS
jgi:hypothetical protein